MVVRRFAESDAGTVSRMIRTAMDISNRKDYPDEIMDALILRETPKYVLEQACRTHMYVALDGEKIIGSGAIGPLRDREDESGLFTVFVLPEYQRKGVGRKIMEALEQDEYFIRAKRIEIRASITGVPFYLRMGYHYRDGISEPDGDLLLRLEKNR